jgi:hypothetical protein
MPTNIIDGRADPVMGNAWQTVGGGAQGLAALLGSAFAARDAAKAAETAKRDAALAPNTSANIVPTITAPVSSGMRPTAPTTNAPAAPFMTQGTSFSPQALQPVTNGMAAGDNGLPAGYVPTYDNSAEVTAEAPKPFQLQGGMDLSRMGVGNVLARQFPSLFPKTSTGGFQTFSYGGL